MTFTVEVGRAYVKAFWKPWFMFFSPIVCASFIYDYSGDSPAARCAFVLLVMAIYWVLEVLPVAVTALIPVAALPLLGIMSTSKVAVNYMKAINFLFMGGLMMAIAVENSGLHSRISLFMLKSFGTGRLVITFSFMLTTALLSMFISNTAATAMMIPIVDAVVRTMDAAEQKAQVSGNNPDNLELSTASDNSDTTPPENPPHELSPSGVTRRRLLMLSVAYAANVGGTGFLTGSPPNLVLPGKLQEAYGPDQPLNFVTWIAFCFPLMIFNLALAYIWISTFAWLHQRLTGDNTEPILIQDANASNASAEIDVNISSSDAADEGENLDGAILNQSRDNQNQDITTPKDAVKKVITAEYRNLGNMTVQERTIAICFTFLVLLWFLRKPGGQPGWLRFFPYEGIVIHDATATILMVLVVFSLPSQYKFWPFISMSQFPEVSAPLLSWGGESGVEKKLQWGVILLLGGGFALSDACQTSGLSESVGSWLSSFLEGLTPFISVLVVCTLTAFFTEFASNTATANILVPILMATSKQLCKSPIFLALPAVLSCSYAFMLPAATAPNAIVKEAADIPTYIMMLAGFVMNILCVMATVGFTFLVAPFQFGLGLPNSPLPEWLTANDAAYANCSQFEQ